MNTPLAVSDRPPATQVDTAGSAWLRDALDPDGKFASELRFGAAALRRRLQVQDVRFTAAVCFEWGRASSLGFGVVQWWIGGRGGLTAVGCEEPLIRRIAGETPFGRRVVFDRGAVAELNRRFAVFLLPDAIAFAVVRGVRHLDIDIGLYAPPRVGVESAVTLFVRRGASPAAALIGAIALGGAIDLGAVLADASGSGRAAREETL